jgi:ornithine cyclodeaminase/alanine dehydrogenase-like protein (mu-crystallin family)
MDEAMTMSDAILRLNVDDVWTALEDVDAVAVVAEELIGRTVGTTIDDGCAITRWTGQGALEPGADLVAVEHPNTGVRCVLAESNLRMSRSAALTALATRELLMPGGVTVAVLSAGRAAQFQLALVARCVPDISHVAIYRPDRVGSGLPTRLVEQLELSGIALSVADSLTDTVFGANLVVAVEETVLSDLRGIRPADLARDTVLVNATGHDLPTNLVDQTGERYVDDLALLADNMDRYFVAAHLRAASDQSRLTPRIAADLGQLLIEGHIRHEQHDRPVLVELLSTDRLSVPLALQILEAALRRRLGSWL